MPEIYKPADDSYLLSLTLKKAVKNKKIKALDMGSGSGIQTQTLIDLGLKQENITIVDINPLAIKHLSNKFSESKVIKSNLFTKIKGKFDLIVFNPPYLPIDKKEPKDSRINTSGGIKGSEIINKFLKSAKNFLADNGRIILLTSTLTKDIDFSGYRKKLLSREKIFFEELFVYKLKNAKKN